MGLCGVPDQREREGGGDRKEVRFTQRKVDRRTSTTSGHYLFFCFGDFSSESIEI